MPLHVVGIVPTEFNSLMNVGVRGPAPQSPYDFSRMKLSCQKGVGRTGADCLCCPRFRSFSTDGRQTTVHCEWNTGDPVWTRMTTKEEVVYITLGTLCRDADELAKKNEIRHLLVRERGHVVGIACRCDFAANPKKKVSQIMNRDVLVIDAGAPLGEAVSAMRLFQVGCLPVVRSGEICGMLTRGDLRRAGISNELLGARACAACGSTHGVRTSDRCPGAELCLDCLERSEEGGDVGGEG